jgi:P27 family predicted phage terminase small subunit
LRAEPQPEERYPDPPDWLTPSARAVWDRVTDELAAMGLLFAADTETIAAYASSAAMLEEAERGFAADELMRVDRDGDQRRSPWLLVRKDALEGIHRFGSALGLSPAARTHLPVSPTPYKTEAELAAERLADRLLS